MKFSVISTLGLASFALALPGIARNKARDDDFDYSSTRDALVKTVFDYLRLAELFGYEVPDILADAGAEEFLPEIISRTVTVTVTALATAPATA